MRPLVYLVSRSFINGIRRVLTNPRRLFGFLFIVAYYFMLTSGVFFPHGNGAGAGFPIGIKLNFPVAEVLGGAVFALYLLMSIFLFSGLGTIYNRTSRPADVDVLFPTPVSPKVVMAFRIIRDYLAASLFPLVIVVIGWRPIRASGLLQQLPHPETAGNVVKTAIVGWILVAMVWTTFGYATTLFVNRSDVKSDRNKRILDISTYVIVFGTIAFIALSIRSDPTWTGALSLSKSPVLRVPYFIAVLGTMFALGPITHPWFSVASGIALLALMMAGYALALTQVGWMYDQAAVRGFETVDSIRQRRAGGIYTQMVHSAQKGKLKVGRQTRLHRMRVRPTATFMWREAIVQLRSLKTSAIIIVLIALFYSMIPIVMFSHIIRQDERQPVQLAGYGFLVCQAFGVFMALSAMAGAGFMEFLKKVDLLKPLPFSPGRLAAMEILAKTLLPVVLVGFCGLLAVIVDPAIWSYVLADVVFMPTFAFVLCSTLLTVMVLFPEVEDRSQRGFRGLVQLFGVGVCCSPGVASFVGLSIVFGQPIISAVVAGAINVAIFLGTSILAGNLYADFNPSD